jgi:hypothetical protein
MSRTRSTIEPIPGSTASNPATARLSVGTPVMSRNTRRTRSERSTLKVSVAGTSAMPMMALPPEKALARANRGLRSPRSSGDASRPGRGRSGRNASMPSGAPQRLNRAPKDLRSAATGDPRSRSLPAQPRPGSQPSHPHATYGLAGAHSRTSRSQGRA